MRTLSINISEVEFNKFGFNKENLSFSDLVELISRELAKKNLKDSVELAEKYGLSNMTMEDISKEVQEARKNAKGRS